MTASALRVPETVAAAAGPLRLARIDDAACRIANHLFGRAATSEFAAPGPALQWRWHAAPLSHDSELTLLCTAGDVRCAISFDAGGACGLDETVDLAVFEGAAFQAAAALRHAAVLAHLGRLGGRTFDEVQAHRGAFVLERDALSIGFTLAEPDTQGPRVLTGRLQLLASQAAFWCRLQGRAAALPPAAAPLQVSAEVWLTQQLVVTAASLRRLRTGGALLLGAASADGLECRLQWAGTAAAWSATLGAPAGDRLRLRAPTTIPPTTDAATARSAPMDSRTDTSDDTGSTVIDALPIVLDFHLGQTTLRLSQLPATLAPGCVIELGRPLDTDAVSVRANGQVLAHGELIQVGDQLAVRISRIASEPDADGFV